MSTSERRPGSPTPASGTASETPSAAGRTGSAGGRPASRDTKDSKANMLPGRQRRRFGVERLLVRLIATGGVIGIGVALGAILASSKVQGWIIGLVIAIVSVLLSAILWSSRQL